MDPGVFHIEINNGESGNQEDSDDDIIEDAEVCEF